MNKKKDKLEFRKLFQEAPNEVLNIGAKAFVSYNPGNHLFGLKAFAADNFSDETALVLDRKFYILNGDFRQEYIDAFKAGGIEACCKLFTERQEKFGSTWTTGTDPEKFLKSMIERIIE